MKIERYKMGQRFIRTKGKEKGDEYILALIECYGHSGKATLSECNIV